MNSPSLRVARTALLPALFALAFMFAPAGAAFAQAPAAIVNEFSSNGASDWVEILNSTSEPVDLSGWYLVVVTASPATTTLSGILPASGILTFALDLRPEAAVGAGEVVAEE